jgi:plastocyanin
MRSRSLATLSFAALALVACSTKSGGVGGTVPAGATLIKAEEAITWDAKTYTATAVNGEVTIAIRNESSLPHNLHLLDSANVDTGISMSVEGRDDVRSQSLALKPGTYQVICSIPGHGNMKATLTVS